jgi:hypothetical protein
VPAGLQGGVGCDLDHDDRVDVDDGDGAAAEVAGADLDWPSPTTSPDVYSKPVLPSWQQHDRDRLG